MNKDTTPTTNRRTVLAGVLGAAALPLAGHPPAPVSPSPLDEVADLNALPEAIRARLDRGVVTWEWQGYEAESLGQLVEGFAMVALDPDYQRLEDDLERALARRDVMRLVHLGTDAHIDATVAAVQLGWALAHTKHHIPAGLDTWLAAAQSMVAAGRQDARQV